MLTSKNFYDQVSVYYEKMIDFDKNLELRTEAYKTIFEGSGRVADIGCGIGLDTIALAKNGNDVTAFDISPQMIKELKQKAKKYDLNIAGYVHSFETIPHKYNNYFDNIVSVGNTIAHLSPKDLKKAFIKMNKLLKPGGKVLIHILNYERIIKGFKRINNIANRDGMIIIRFYDFLKTHLNFNILSLPSNNPKEYRLVTTKHYPHSRSIIYKYAKDTKYKKVSFHGDFKLGKFKRNASKDMFVLLVK